MDIIDLYYLFQFDYISSYIGHIKSYNKELNNVKYLKKSKNNDNSYVYTTSSFDNENINYIVKTGDIDIILNEYFVGKKLNEYRHLCDGIVYMVYIFNSDFIKNVSINNYNIIDLLKYNKKFYNKIQNPKDFYINRLTEIPHIIYEKVEGINFSNFMKDINDTQEVFDYVISILLTLSFLLENCGFVHNDLHLDNIILKPYNKIYKLNIKNETFEIKLKNIPVLIDYGLSHITVDKNISMSTQNYEEYNIQSDILHYSYDIYKLILSICAILFDKNIKHFNKMKWMLEFLLDSTIYNKLNDISYAEKYFETEYEELFSNKNFTRIEINPLNYLFWLINNINKSDLKLNLIIKNNDNIVNKLIDKHQNYLHKLPYFTPIYNIFNIELCKNLDIKTYDTNYITYLQKHNINYTKIDFNYNKLITYYETKINYDENIIKKQINNLLEYLNKIINYENIYDFISNFDKLFYLYFYDIYNYINFNNNYIYDYNELINLYNYVFRQFNSKILNCVNINSLEFYTFFNYCMTFHKNNNLLYDSFNNLQKKYYDLYIKRETERNPKNFLYIPPCVNFQLTNVDKKKLHNLLFKHFNISKNILYEIFDKNKTDISIYDILKNYKKIYQPTDTNYRVIKRIKEIEQLTHNLFKHPIENYLDFGGGDGSITLGISKYFKCINTYCVDIKNWDDNKPRKYLYNQLNYIDVNKYNPTFNILQNSLNLITAFQVFHHMLDVSTTLKILYDLLKPGGYLIIREHDCDNNDTRMLIDIEHILYDYVYDEIPNCINNYFAYYKTKNEWINIITNIGFKHISTNPLVINNNTTKYYFDIFIK